MNSTGKPKVITVHRNRCIGCGYCLLVEQSFWVISPKDGKITTEEFIGTEAQTIKVTIPFELAISVLELNKVCPMEVFK